MRRPILAVADYSTVGLELALSVLFGLLGGQWLDKKFGTTYLVLAGFGLGIFAGFRAVWKAARRMKADAEAEAKAAGDDEPPSLSHFTGAPGKPGGSCTPGGSFMPGGSVTAVG